MRSGLLYGISVLFRLVGMLAIVGSVVIAISNQQSMSSFRGYTMTGFDVLFTMVVLVYGLVISLSFLAAAELIRGFISVTENSDRQTYYLEQILRRLETDSESKRTDKTLPKIQ